VKDSPKEVRTSIILPDALLHRLKVQAAKERTHVSGLLRRLAEEYLAKRKT
jgi:metal-responsive CopG/Arc/MetJ family transcriptional regulator